MPKKKPETHAEFLKRMGYKPLSNKQRRLLRAIPSYKIENEIPTSDTIGNGFKKSIDDYRWKRGLSETKETVEAIELKKKQIVPLYNKGGYQYAPQGPGSCYKK
jgi:hypothetical protein